MILINISQGKSRSCLQVSVQCSGRSEGLIIYPGCVFYAVAHLVKIPLK